MAGMAHDFWKTKLTRGRSVKQFQEIARISLPSVFSFLSAIHQRLEKQSWQHQKEKYFHRKLPSHEDHVNPACTVSKLPDGQEKAILK